MKLNQIKTEYLLLLVIVILGFGLRIYDLDRSLWLDEAFSVNSQKDFQRHISNIYYPMHLYFVVLHFFMLFGTSEVMIRASSVVFGVFSIILMYKLGKLLFGRAREGLVGAFLLSISAMHIEHSQEARYYSLTTFLSLLSFFLLYKAIKENDKKLWVGYIFSTVLAVLSHYYMIFIPLIQIVFVVFMAIKNRNSFIFRVKKIGKNKIFLLVFGLIIISLFSFPLIQSILEEFLTGSGYVGVATWGIPPESYFQDLFSIFSFNFTFSYSSILLGTLITAIFLGIYLLFLSLGLITIVKKHSEEAALLLLWIFLPAVIVFIISVTLNSPIIDAKYLIFIIPGYLLCVSRGISSVSSTILKYYYKIVYGLSSIPLLEKKRLTISLAIIVVIMGLFVGISVIPLQEHYESPSEDWKSAVEYLESKVRIGDVIITEPPYLEQILDYYYEQNSSKTAFMKSITTTIDSPVSRYRNFLDIISRNERVWIVMSPRHLDYFNSGILNWTLYNSIEAGVFQGVSIYSRPSRIIHVYTNTMNFVGLDSPPDDPVASFWQNNDSATFSINILKPTNYTIVIHAKSLVNSALEIVIDGESKGIKTFSESEWTNVELGKFYMRLGSHEIQIINKEDEYTGDTNVDFDRFIIWENQ